MKNGYDVYETAFDIMKLLQFVQNSKVHIYQIQIKEKIIFTSTYSYRKLLVENENIKYCYSIGSIGMFFRFFTIEKIIAACCACILYFFLSHTIFQLDIIGESVSHQQLISHQLQIYKPPFFYQNDKKLISELKKLNQQLNWYAVYQKGSKLEIHFLPRKKIELNEYQSYNLVASKEGVIAGFDVSKGTKMVKINQKVNKGDILVSHILVDSRNQEKTSQVYGKVYAYTFHRIDVEMKKNSLPESVLYYECLLLSRMQIQLNENERIVKEIPLQFKADSDTIRMSNYYILYEMISVVGDSDE